MSLVALAWQVAPHVCTTGPRNGHIYYILILACNVNECDLSSNILVICYRIVSNEINISNSIHMTKRSNHTTFLCLSVPLVSPLSLYLYLYIIPLVLHDPQLKQT